MTVTPLDRATVKITLTPEETRARMLHRLPPHAEEDSLCPEERASLSALLSEAEPLCPDSLSLPPRSVRLYPCATGGLEIYLTVEPPCPDTLCRLPSEICALSLCLALSGAGYRGGSELYLAENGESYLRILAPHPPIAEEFGQVLPLRGEEALPYLREHCARLALTDRFEP